MKNILCVFLLWCFSAFTAFAVDTTGDADIPATDKTAGVDLRDPEVVKKGMAMLSSTCGGYCHGTEGRGFKGPSLRNRTDLDVDSLHATITFGRKRAGRLMPAWGGALLEEQIWTAIAAIVSLRHVEPDSQPKPAAH
jgi:mono/diheme cytochrome c family protein